ncbi:hypothetical protein HDV00_000629 [Rhizophlyctis rosea]|nr:hypothetical protein HDV00_000629 [Rhizophlyctis rosea]
MSVSESPQYLTTAPDQHSQSIKRIKQTTNDLYLLTLYDVPPVAIYINPHKPSQCQPGQIHIPKYQHHNLPQFKARSLLDPIQHIPGKLPRNITDVSDKARGMVHGVRLHDNNGIKDVVFPARLNPLLAEREQRREAYYHRREHQPLGRSLPPQAPLPAFVRDPSFKFDISAKELLFPYLPDYDEDEDIRRMYMLSHESYRPGERRMPYGPLWVPPAHPSHAWTADGSRFNNDGHRVKDGLYWATEREKERGTVLRSKREMEWRERTHPQLGKVHDPIKETISHLPPTHTFGITFPPDPYTVSDLLGTTRPAPQPPTQKHRPTTSTPAGLPTQPIHPIEPHTTYRKDEIEGGMSLDGIVAKITAAPVGGEMGERRAERLDMRGKRRRGRKEKGGEGEGKRKGEGTAFGVPSVRWGSRFVSKRLGDSTNYGDESDAKALICPTPRNVYGVAQLKEFERHLRDLRSKMATGSSGGVGGSGLPPSPAHANLYAYQSMRSQVPGGGGTLVAV